MSSQPPMGDCRAREAASEVVEFVGRGATVLEPTERRVLPSWGQISGQVSRLPYRR